jgi:hypothetical protein
MTAKSIIPRQIYRRWGGFDKFIDCLRETLNEDNGAATAVGALRTANLRAAAYRPAMIEVTKHRLKVIATNPGLAGEGAVRSAELVDHMSESITLRDRYAPGGLRITANAVAAAANSALTWWRSTVTDDPRRSSSAPSTWPWTRLHRYQSTGRSHLSGRRPSIRAGSAPAGERHDAIDAGRVGQPRQAPRKQRPAASSCRPTASTNIPGRYNETAVP